jgi:hypothetical protein
MKTIDEVRIILKSLTVRVLDVVGDLNQALHPILARARTRPVWDAAAGKRKRYYLITKHTIYEK